MELVIIGAGGFAKEIIFLVERTNRFNVIGLIDDNYFNLPDNLLSYPLLGGIDYLKNLKKNTAVVIGISDPDVKRSIWDQLKKNDNLFFPNIVDDTALIGSEVSLGIGNIIMAYTTFSANIKVGDFNMINIHSTIGHDTIIKNFNSIYPAVNLSGNVHVGSGNEFGVGTKVIPGIDVGDDNKIGAGSVVIRNIKNKSKIVGVPAKIIESWD
ncbi:hypothetical protein IGI96_002711 [Enterococcus sp. DIV0421]|uniref:acetyltransferase n=1 Tax=Enterococcus sp. DIV0421 TaxID=2774688 RepID=UPI003F284A5C